MISTGTKKYGQFTGVTDFVRLSLQRIVWMELRKSAGTQGEPVF
jgi:hypothetical protein